MRNEKILVSICCVTYNQSDYISDAIESFLAQETSFNFEILVYDDASTDGTTEILKNYAAKYPGFIKVIYQKENQFSKGVHVHAMLWAYASGLYLAFCDGDDYWVDADKLEAQVKALQANPRSDICFHGHVNLKDGSARSQILRCKKYFSLSEVIRGGGDFMSTSSLMVRKKLINQMPDWYFTAPIGDYFLQMLGARRGGAIYIPSCMSVYRISSEGSWSFLRKKYSSEKIKDHFGRLDVCMKNMYLEVDSKYKRDVDYARADIFISQALAYFRRFNLYCGCQSFATAIFLAPFAVYKKIIKKFENL